jgi:Domain of Unknown Function (DUF928)
MRTFLTTVSLATAAFALLVHDAGAASSLPAPQIVQGGGAPAYVPPMRGAPEARVSGGTRGAIDGPKLDALAPDHTGWTLQEQPTLYWFSSGPIEHDVVITVIADESNKTVLKTTIHGPVPAGINAIRLAGTAAHLEPDVDYQWTVTAMNSQQERSRNPVATGMVKRVLPAELPSGVAGSDAAALARAGLWYDAIDALSQGIQRAPKDRTLHDYRAGLLTQVGLTDAAEFDRKAEAR